MKEVIIAAATRTPIGSFGGSLSNIPAPLLGATVIKGILQQSGLSANEIDEVILGNVLQANLGQAPARQAAIFGGLSYSTVCSAVNKVCASGTKSVIQAAQSIACGDTNIVIAGGMENMSSVPFYAEKVRFGNKLGHTQLTDGLLKDGLWDVYNDYHMGNAAEATASNMGITREMQDNYAINSYKRAALAWQSGFFKSEITPVEIPQKGKDSYYITEDEEYKSVNFDKLPLLKPVFDKQGTITAANASTLNDGAAALLITNTETASKKGLTPIARIIGYADAAQEPALFTTAPSIAIPKALKKANISINDVDYFEINEAFSAVAIANNIALNLNPEKVNVWGGAVALGHPLGASGARIIVTLINILQRKKGKIGVAAICNGGGGASAVVIELL